MIMEDGGQAIAGTKLNVAWVPVDVVEQEVVSICGEEVSEV